MPTPSISIKNARKIVLNAQQLLHPPRRDSQTLENMIQHLGYIQIDTISVIERAHHHVMWTRHNDYQPAMLDALVKAKKVFEYWYHAASYLPISDYRFCLPRMEAIKKKEPRRIARTHALYQQVLERIRAEGPLQAKDFESDQTKRTGWWDWKPAKRALEQLFMEGELLVVGRKGFQKIYDLPERALPSGLNHNKPTREEFARFLIRRGIRAQGLITEAQIGYLQGGIKQDIRTALQHMLENGDLLQVRLEKRDGHYVTMPQILEQSLRLPRKKQLFFLSPFDNSVIQRRRLLELFDFDYQLECYVPAPKRKYGYFTLPLLWGDTFVGRVDMKADRKSRTLIIKNLVLEKKTVDWDQCRHAFKESLAAFMAFNGCCSVDILQTDPVTVKQQLTSPT